MLKRNEKGQYIGLEPFKKECIFCGKYYFISGSSRSRRIKKSKFCSTKCRYSLGHSDETRKKISSSITGDKNPFYGKHHSKELKEKISKLSSSRTGDKSGRWKGGITPKYLKIRHSKKYSNWRFSVFERDNFTCQICGNKNIYLHADHIKPFAYFPKLRFDINNGRTLCIKCHYFVTWNKEINEGSKWGSVTPLN